MNSTICIKKCADDNVKIHPHCNSKYCSQKIIEIDPAVGCGFECQYCCVYTQEKDCQFNNIIVYEDYSELLEKYIIENQSRLDSLTFFYSFESDCFQDALINTGMTEKILKVLKKYDVKYFLLTKGGIPPEEIRQLLIETKQNVQIVVNDTMPNEEMKQRLEPYAADVAERYRLVEYCLQNGIFVTISFSPILPFIDISYLKSKIDQYVKIGITHFRLDMLELSENSLKRIETLVPEYKDELRRLYLGSDRIENNWTAPKSQKIVNRYKPSEEQIAKIYMEIDKYLCNISPKVTVSICDEVGATNKYLKGFNKRAYSNGFNCMGVKFK